MIKSPINIIILQEEENIIGVFYYGDLIYKHTDRKVISAFVRQKFGSYEDRRFI